MKYVFTLEDFIFKLCKDEDIFIKVVDYKTGEIFINGYLKNYIRGIDEYEHHKYDEVENVSLYSFLENIGFEITVKYY